MTATLPETLKKPRKAAQRVVEPPVTPALAPPGTVPRVIGVDLSLTATGVAWSTGEVITFGRDGLTGNKLSPTRKAVALDALARDLVIVITSRVGVGEIVVLGIELLPASGTRSQAERSFVYWRVMYLLGMAGVPVMDISPGQIKQYITGMGDANKREVQAAVQRYLPQFNIHRTSKRTGAALGGLDDNKADAVTICAMLCDLLGHPIVEVPASHRAALAKLTLPEGVNR